LEKLCFCVINSFAIKVAADIGGKFIPPKSSIEYMVEMPILAP